MKKYDIKNIMVTAHNLTENARRDFPAADYSVTLRAALRIAWKAEKKQLSRARAAEIDEINARAALDALRADFWEKYANAAPRVAWDAIKNKGDLCMDILTRGVWKARETDMAGTDKRGNPRPPVMDWIVSADDAQSVAAQVWIDMDDAIERAAARDDENGTETHIATVIYRAAARAARNIHKAECTNPSALRTKRGEHNETLRYENGEKVQYFVGIDESPIAEKIAPAPDVAACLNDAITAVCADDIDREIIAFRASGYTQAETAAAFGLKQYQVSRRMGNARARYAAEHYARNEWETAPAPAVKLAYTPAAAPAPVIAWSETKTPAARAAAAESAKLARDIESIKSAWNFKRKYFNEYAQTALREYGVKPRKTLSNWNSKTA